MASSTCSFWGTSSIIRTSPNRKIGTTITRAARREHHNYEGKLVDENLIVLRKRIHEMKMMETNYEPPKEWMDWEKQSYDSVICDAMGHLQTYLMETRPSLLLGVIALIALSVPTSTAVVIYNLLQLSRGILLPSEIHLN